MEDFIEKCKCDFKVYQYLQQLLKYWLEETEVDNCIDEIRKGNYRFCTNHDHGERKVKLSNICEWNTI